MCSACTQGARTADKPFWTLEKATMGSVQIFWTAAFSSCAWPVNRAADIQCTKNGGVEREAWLHARLKARTTRPPLPSLLLANVCSLKNKMDVLRTSTVSQHETRECCALIVMETWTTASMPDLAIQLQTHSVHLGNLTSASGKNRW